MASLRRNERRLCTTTGEPVRNRDLWDVRPGSREWRRRAQNSLVAPTHLRDAIAQHVWDDYFDPLTNVIDVYIKRLRAKLDSFVGRLKDLERLLAARQQDEALHLLEAWLMKRAAQLDLVEVDGELAEIGRGRAARGR